MAAVRSSHLATLVGILTLGQNAFAQLTGLPNTGPGDVGCTIGNANYDMMGIGTFDSAVAPNSKLTWTEGLTPLGANASGSSEIQYIRNFYLGTPPTLDLANASAFAGCALFFEGMDVPLNTTNQYGSVTCDELLQAQCVVDMQAQAKEHLTAILGSSSGSSNDNAAACGALQSALQVKPPKSCSKVAKDSWGTIVAKSITGPKATLSPLQNPSCNASTGGPDYNIALIETQTLFSPSETDGVMYGMYGVTPIMTIFYSTNGAEMSSLPEPETHLTCMKVLEDKSEDGNSGSSDVASAAGLPVRLQLFDTTGTWFVMILGLVGAFFANL